MNKFYKILSMLCFALAIISAVTYVKEDPFLAFVCGFFGVALGIVLYEVSELRERWQAISTAAAQEHQIPAHEKPLQSVQK